MADEAQSQSSMRRGLVKQVLSGDAVVIMGPIINGPPKEITVYLSNINSPRLAKRPTENTEGTTDEPFAWEAREFLRKKIVGQSVVFMRDFIATSGREHGRIYLGGTNINDAENVAETGVAEGWFEVKQGKVEDEYTKKLLELQEQAKADKKGRWGVPEEKYVEHIRSIKWVIDDPRALVAEFKHQPIDAVIEMVRDGSTIRALLLPTFHYVTVMLSGVKAPAVRMSAEGRSEEYGEEAKYFVETRLLQRDVKVVLESTSNQNFLGSIIHPKGNIAEFLLREGFAKCVDWSISSVTGGPTPLRDAERAAKERKLRLWRTYAGNAQIADRKSFQGKVIEIGLGDSINVEKDNGEELKIYLSSIRPPRKEGPEGPAVGRQFRPLYDIPFMFEAREFLRKRLIGKRVTVTVDYVQPRSDQFPEKTGCTVMLGNQNIAEALIAKGLAKVIRYRADDENRAPTYDMLLAAEAEAEKGKKGMWADKSEDKHGVVRVQELQGDVQRSKQFLPFLQRSTRLDGVVEFVASGSRFRVYIPKETCIITFLLGGINVPRGARPGPGGKLVGENEPYAGEAMKFSKSKALQYEVQIEVESMDKSGGFIGYMFVPTDKGNHVNLAELLVENGLASVHFTAEKSRYYNQLLAAESRAKTAHRNLWKDHVEEERVEERHQVGDVSERKVNYKKVVVTEIVRGTLRFAAQTYDDGPAIEKLMSNLQSELSATAIEGSYTPRRGDVCAAKFDNLWHRAKVESAKGGKIDIYYVDFGNRETVELSRLAPLPAHFHSQSPGAREYQLALVQMPNDPHYDQETTAYFEQVAFSVPSMLLNVEYKNGNYDAVSLWIEEDGNKQDVGKLLVSEGHALVERRKEKRLQSLVDEYIEAEQSAKRTRKNIWEYGDFTGNEI